MKKAVWKTTALLVALALSASLASGKPSKKAKVDDDSTKEALKTATENFVRIEAGTFMMGICEERREDRDGALHYVTLTRAFYICDHEVTNAEYKAVMGKPSHHLSKGDDLPVVYVTWDKAIDYCNALSEMQGLTPCYTKVKSKVTCDFTANGYRLPTDAEWECAARAGDNSTEVRVWSGIHEEPDWDRSTMENAVGEYAWYEYNSGRKLHPGKEKNPNAWGLYDMTGNVWEWCWDWYASSSSEPATDPTGPTSPQAPLGACRVIRGGAGWDSGPANSITFRNHSHSMGQYHPWVGFRVVRTADD